MAEERNLSQGGSSGHTPEPGQQQQSGSQSQQGQRGGAGGGAQGTDQAAGAQGLGTQRQEGQRGTFGQEGQQLQRSSGQGGMTQGRGEGELGRYSRNPFAMLQQMSEEMDSLFESFFGRPSRRQLEQSRVPSLWAPEVEISEEGNRLRVSVDLPGVSKDNVKIDVEEGVLVLQGERREERSEGGEQQGFRRTERRYGSFYRAIPLPENVDTENAEARMHDGVLEISLPISERRQGKRLEIR